MITALVCMYRLPRREIGRADKRDQAIQGSESCGLELEGHISELASTCVNCHNKIRKKKSVYKDKRQLQHLPHTGCHPMHTEQSPPSGFPRCGSSKIFRDRAAPGADQPTVDLPATLNATLEKGKARTARWPQGLRQKRALGTER